MIYEGLNTSIKYGGCIARYALEVRCRLGAGSLNSLRTAALAFLIICAIGTPPFQGLDPWARATRSLSGMFVLRASLAGLHDHVSHISWRERQASGLNLLRSITKNCIYCYHGLSGCRNP